MNRGQALSSGVRFSPEQPSAGRSLALVPAALALLLLAACGRPVTPLCAATADCDAGSSCSAGVCVVGGLETCTTDLDCNPRNDEICQAGICVAGGDADPNNSGGASCGATADCPTSQFCNTATGVCAPLLEGWCRLDTQCDAGLCSNRDLGEDFPGRCVECVDSADCGGAACISPGVCEVQAPGCPTNSSAVAGGSCRCDPGFSDDGAGGCAPNTTATEGEGETEPTEGEGEPEPAEGEGEVEPVPADGCVTMGECMESHGFDYTCDTGSGECVCDEAWMQVICDDGYDLVACECGGTSGGGGGNPMANQECFEDADCGGLSCIFSVPASGLFDAGYCKEVCDTDADCSGGLACMDDVFGDGSGICAEVGTNGDTCEASIYQYDIGTDALCDGGATGILDCFSNRCEEVCNWAGKSGPPETCSGGGTCGALQFRAESGSSVAVCN